MRIPGRKPRRRTAPPPLPPEFSVHTEAFELGMTVAIAGELDIATAPHLRAALDSSELAVADAVVIDLGDVTFMDSTGLGLLLEFDRDLRTRNGRLAIACPDGPARLLFDVTGVSEMLQLHGSREAAQSALAGDV